MGHPGQEIRCRCGPNPVMDDIFGEGFMKEAGLETRFEKAEWLKKEEEWARKKGLTEAKKPKSKKESTAKVKKAVSKKVSTYVKKRKSVVTKKHEKELKDSVTPGSGFKSFESIMPKKSE